MNEDSQSKDGVNTLMSWLQVEIWLAEHLIITFLGLAGLVLLFLVISIIFLTMVISLKKRYRKLMMGRDGLNLEQVLNHYETMISEGEERQADLARRMDDVEGGLKIAIAGIGMVRYNAFQETGSDLSFSLALLDRRQSGAVVTSIFGREESRCYGKPVVEGRSSYNLSEEEEQALAAARRNMGL